MSEYQDVESYLIIKNHEGHMVQVSSGDYVCDKDGNTCWTTYGDALRAISYYVLDSVATMHIEAGCGGISFAGEAQEAHALVTALHDLTRDTGYNLPVALNNFAEVLASSLRESGYLDIDGQPVGE